MLIPLAIPLAQMLQIDPRLLVIIIAISSSIDFALVIGTPPTMMAYSTGLFQVREIFKRGVSLRGQTNSLSYNFRDRFHEGHITVNKSP